MSVQLPLLVLTAAILMTAGGQAHAIEHSVVYHETGRFGGWPANNGLWSWEDGEVLVGFTRSFFQEQRGDSERPPRESLLARSLEGRNWMVEEPAGFFPEESLDLTAPAGPFDFAAEGFMMRVVGAHYHGAAEPRGAFLCSRDRGRSWEGPFEFQVRDLPAELRPEDGARWTPRTDVVLLGPAEALVLCSARDDAAVLSDRVFALRTTDGAQTFTFEGWVVDPADPYRAVMPATVQHDEGELVTAIRRRRLDRDLCWIDAYASTDGGRTWSLRGLVGYTGGSNGNPPALAVLADGRLCTVFGDRSRRKLLARYSADGGRTWTEEVVLRSDYRSDRFGFADLGYPRLTRRPDGSMLAVYYWATAERPEPHIAATTWRPEASPSVRFARGIELRRVSTNQPYELDIADVGVRPYLDRDYVITELPQHLHNATLLRTLNEDDRVEAEDHVVLELDTPQTLTVALRVEGTSLPGWMSEWADTGERMSTTDIRNDVEFRLYQRHFPSGRVMLGGTERDATGTPGAWFAFAQPAG